MKRFNIEDLKDIQEAPGLTNKPNLYLDNGRWYWYDETYLPSEPYETEAEAKRVLNRYVSWLMGEIQK